VTGVAPGVALPVPDVMPVSTPARGGVRRARDQVGMPNGLRLATDARMALESAILSGSSRLEQAVAGGPSVKKRPPDDEGPEGRSMPPG
jgi:hypothetical protein